MKNVKNLKFLTACIMLATGSANAANSNTVDIGSTISNAIESYTGYKTGNFGVSGENKLTEYYPVLSDYMHYSIGSGSAVSAPASRGTPNQYGLGIGWKSNLTCGNFDMKFSIKNQLNGITEGFKDLYGNIIESATGAVASLPAMIIQRANPQLYDMLSNGLYQGKLDFNNFKTSCEAMSNQLADLAMDSKWAKMAGLQDAAKIAENETDAMAARKKIDEDSKKKGEKGIVWVGGETKGGKNQKPIEIIGDVVGAGYNIAIGRQATEKGQVVNCDGMLCLEWDTPEKAATYAKELLGEKILRTCTTCGDATVETKAGKGLNAFIEKTTIEKATQLEEALNNMSELTPKQLNAMGTSTVAVTQGVLEAIASSPDAAILGARLANELAISKELEKAIGLRRMLLAGMREPNVENNPEAQTDIEKALKLLDREIEQVKLEMELQRSINGNTALAAITQQMNEQMLAVDDNNLGNGNRRFANLSKEAGSNNITGNVNGATSQAVGTRYIAIPKSDGTGMSDFYGTYAAAVSNAVDVVSSSNFASSSFDKVEAPSWNKRVYTNADGTTTTKEGGSLSWRNNNPGNMMMCYPQYKGESTSAIEARCAKRWANSNDSNVNLWKQQGAIGYSVNAAGGYLIFASEEAGAAAQASLLDRKYNNLSIIGITSKYAPPDSANGNLGHNNDPEAYARSIAKAIGVSTNTNYNSLSQEQKINLAKAMAVHEGWKAGTTSN